MAAGCGFRLQDVSSRLWVLESISTVSKLNDPYGR